MVDMEGYFEDPSVVERPLFLDNTDCRNWLSDCRCAVCKARGKEDRDTQPLFDEYNSISPSDYDDLTPHQYLLCPSQIPAFVFRTRTWGETSEPHLLHMFLRLLC